MKKNFRGFGFYVILILIVIGVWYMLDSNQSAANTYSALQFEEDLEEGNIAAVKINQNREVPTGILEIVLKDSTTRELFVSDVTDTQKMLDEYQQDYQVRDVPAESWLMNLLPLLLVFGAMFILFIIVMNNQAAANGGGSKMMNFGKSHAKMSTDMDKKVTFDNVAGLKEEKEE